MADVITNKTWSLDTAAGLVTQNPFIGAYVNVVFTTAAAGVLVLATSQSANVICTLKSWATATANAFQTSQVFPLGNQTYNGLTKVTCTNCDTIEIITGVPN